MPFNLKKVIKKTNTYVAQSSKPVVNKEENVETIQEIVIPVYEPEPEIVLQKYESDDETVAEPRKIKSKVVSRKVPLNPLSD